MSDSTYKINDNLIYREDEGVFFSLESMEIYKLDELSSDIMLFILGKNKIVYDDFLVFYTSIEDIDISYCNEFFQQLISMKLIVAC